ncbi:uncharacterized protein C16orf86 homolog [Ambystoma mexicanum]|uniref:uncharacterized protein C16orf86 homolog n=1 Tax=Ambystoma mexicanum TaxID=8296 RepID=UPI0037E70CBD
MTEEKKSAKSSRKANNSRFMGKLAAILENPGLKSLQWDESGDAVLVNVKLYEEEIEQLGEFLPELRNFRSISMLHGLLCTFGFKKKVAKVDAEVHVFQHLEFKRKAMAKTEESEILKVEDSGNSTKQPKKPKKRKKESVAEILPPPVTITPFQPPEQQGLEKKPSRLRALYQYINYNNPEMNRKSDGETDTEETEPPWRTVQEESPLTDALPPKWFPAAGIKEDSLKPMKSLCLGRQVKPELDKSTQVDIDKMLSVCAAHLVPPLSPQYK